jgi:hypothetical protein
MRKRSNPDSEANIRRIDSKPKAKKQTHGFQVHFLRGGSSVSKMFSDKVYGGKESARRAARKFKRTAMSDLPERVFSGPTKRPAGAKKSAAAKGKAASAKKAGGSKSSARGSRATKKSSAKKTKSRR